MYFPLEKQTYPILLYIGRERELNEMGKGDILKIWKSKTFQVLNFSGLSSGSFGLGLFRARALRAFGLDFNEKSESIN